VNTLRKVGPQGRRFGLTLRTLRPCDLARWREHPLKEPPPPPVVVVPPSSWQQQQAKAVKAAKAARIDLRDRSGRVQAPDARTDRDRAADTRDRLGRKRHRDDDDNGGGGGAAAAAAQEEEDEFAGESGSGGGGGGAAAATQEDGAQGIVERALERISVVSAWKRGTTAGSRPRAPRSSDMVLGFGDTWEAFLRELPSRSSTEWQDELDAIRRDLKELEAEPSGGGRAFSWHHRREAYTLFETLCVDLLADSSCLSGCFESGPHKTCRDADGGELHPIEWHLASSVGRGVIPKPTSGTVDEGRRLRSAEEAEEALSQALLEWELAEAQARAARVSTELLSPPVSSPLTVPPPLSRHPSGLSPGAITACGRREPKQEVHLLHGVLPDPTRTR